MRIKSKVPRKKSASSKQRQRCKSATIKEVECARHKNKVRLHIGLNVLTVLDVWIVSLADCYLAISTTFITEKIAVAGVGRGTLKTKNKKKTRKSDISDIHKFLTGKNRNCNLITAYFFWFQESSL